jgi:hypothetical protein
VEAGERWEVGGGRWEVGGGRWEVGGGRWEVGGGRWEVGGERWEVGGGRPEAGGGRREGWHTRCFNKLASVMALAADPFKALLTANLIPRRELKVRIGYRKPAKIDSKKKPNLFFFLSREFFVDFGTNYQTRTKFIIFIWPFFFPTLLIFLL